MDKIPSFYFSDIAFFHDQSKGGLTTDFNSYYANNSQEKMIPYSSEAVTTAFEPLIKLLRSKTTSLHKTRILEIGGSTGILSKYLQDQGAIVTMIEIQPTFVDQAKSRGVDARIYNGSNLFSTINSGEQFNIIVANRVFEDIVMSEYSATSLIRQSSSFLKQDSFFLIGSQNPSAIWNYGFFSNGFKLIDTQQSFFSPYIKEARIYQK